MQLVGHIDALWRYPVKSMGGEQAATLFAGVNGIAGDRLLAFESAGAPKGKPLLRGAERAAQLCCRARLLPQSSSGGIGVEVTMPDGRCFRADDPRLIGALQCGVAPPAMWLRTSDRPHAECRPISLMSRQTLQQLSGEAGFPVDSDRFRANLLLDLPGLAAGFPEDAFAGCRLRIGNQTTLLIKERTPRCRVITIDPVTGEAAPTLMKLMADRHQGRAGIYAAAVIPGCIRRGDPVFLLDASS